MSPSSPVWSVEYISPETVYPVLLHAHVQKLISNIRVVRGLGHEGVIPRLAIRLVGLVDVPWPINLHQQPNDKNCFVADENVFPPISVSLGELDRVSESVHNLEILVDGQRISSKAVTVLPPAAVPTNIEYAISLATLIMPTIPEVVEFVRRARERSIESRIGFPGMNAARAAETLYWHLSRSREPAYAWEPGPSHFHAAYQTVRLPYRVLREGQATCIDLALLLCSGLEHIRRLPVIVGIRVHEFLWHIVPGVRTNDDDLGHPAVIFGTDKVRRSCPKRHVLLLDPDALIRGTEPIEADMSARRILESAQDAFMVDVQAARESGVWPLPVTTGTYPFAPQRSSVQLNNIVESDGSLPEELVREIANGQTVVMLGDVLDPTIARSRASLVETLSKQAGLSPGDILAAGARLEKRLGRNKLEQLVLNLLTTSRRDVQSPIYRLLAQLPLRTVISFHPDPVLENTLKHRSPPFQVLLSDDDLTQLRLQHELYLLGGSAVSGQEMVLTWSDHLHLLRRIDVLGVGLRTRLASQSLLLIGCDLSDLNLKALYLEASKNIKRRVRPVYACGCHNLEQWIESDSLVELAKQPAELVETLANIMPVPMPAINPSTGAPDVVVTRPPYKYLDYYEAEDKEIFFGRDEDAQSVIKEILGSSSRIAVLCGRSGVGKTSLVKALLIPELEKQQRALTLYIRGSSDPVVSAIDQFKRSVAAIATKDLKTLQDASRYAFEFEQREQIIFVDQAEEMLIKVGSAILKTFFHAVRHCASSRDSVTRFVFIIREDYLARLATYQAQVPGLFSSVYPVKELTRAAAEEAIRKPAELCHIEVHKELIEEILDDLSADSILPAHLQIVCDRVYQECKPTGILTLVAYENLGRAANILSNYLEEAMKKLPHGMERPARAILKALITSEHTKDLVTLEQLVSRTRMTADQLQSSLQALIHSQRLVRECLGQSVGFELAHESLAKSISTWLDADEAKTRAVQEILDMEVGSARKIPGYEIPKDRLALINTLREFLVFDDEAIRVLVLHMLIKGLWDEFWHVYLNHFEPRELLPILLWPAAKISERVFGELFKGPGDDLLRQLPATAFPREVGEALGKLAFGVGPGTLDAVIACAYKDQTYESQRTILRRISSAPEPRIQEILRSLVKIAPSNPSLPKPEEGVLGAGCTLSLLFSEDTFERMLPQITAGESPILLVVAEFHNFDPRLGLSEIIERVRSAVTAWRTKDPINQVASLYLLSCICSPEMMLPEVESAIIEALVSTPEFMETTLELPFSALLRSLAGWATRIKSIKPRSLILKRLRTLALHLLANQRKNIDEILISAPLNKKIAVTEFLGVLLRRVPSNVAVLVEANTLSGEDLSLRMASAKALTRWEYPAGLIAIGDLLADSRLSSFLRAECSVCLKRASNRLLRRCAFRFLYSHSLRDLFIDELLSRKRVAWLTKYPDLIKGLLSSFRYYRRPGGSAELEQLLLRLMPSAARQVEYALKMEPKYTRLAAQRILRIHTREAQVRAE